MERIRSTVIDCLYGNKYNNNITYFTLRMNKKIMIYQLARCLQLESNSDSSDNEENILLLLKIKNNLKRIPRMRCKNYIEDVVSLYTNKEFQMHFR